MSELTLSISLLIVHLKEVCNVHHIIMTSIIHHICHVLIIFIVALVSGFSPSILKVLMEAGEIDPVSIMKLSINAPRYQPLVV